MPRGTNSLDHVRSIVLTFHSRSSPVCPLYLPSVASSALDALNALVSLRGWMAPCGCDVSRAIAHRIGGQRAVYAMYAVFAVAVCSLQSAGHRKHQANTAVAGHGPFYPSLSPPSLSPTVVSPPSRGVNVAEPAAALVTCCLWMPAAPAVCTLKFSQCGVIHPAFATACRDWCEWDPQQRRLAPDGRPPKKNWQKKNRKKKMQRKILIDQLRESLCPLFVDFAGRAALIGGRTCAP